MPNDKEQDRNWWKVTLGQGGNKLIAILDDEQWAALNDALFARGVTCTMMIAENNVLRGITVVPRQGGIVFNVEAATPVLIMNGQLATQAEINAFQHQFRQANPSMAPPEPQRIEPWHQPKARIVFPSWSVAPVPPSTVIDSEPNTPVRPPPSAKTPPMPASAEAAPPARPARRPAPPVPPATNGAEHEPPPAKPAKRAPPAPPPEAS